MTGRDAQARPETGVPACLSMQTEGETTVRTHVAVDDGSRRAAVIDLITPLEGPIGLRCDSQRTIESGSGRRIADDVGITLAQAPRQQWATPDPANIGRRGGRVGILNSAARDAESTTEDKDDAAQSHVRLP